MQARARATRKEAEENMLTPEGQAYRKELEQTLAGYLQSCLKEYTGDAHQLDFFVQVGKNAVQKTLRQKLRRTMSPSA